MASVHSHRGNRMLGLFYLTLDPSVHNTHSYFALIPPFSPVQHPTIPDESMGHQINEIWRQHKLDYNGFQKYDYTDKALKFLLLQEVDKVYIRPLREKYIVYKNVTTLTIIMHLYTGYARFTQGGIEENDKILKEEWYPNQPIEALFEQIEYGIYYVSTKSTPYSPEQIIPAS